MRNYVSACDGLQGLIERCIQPKGVHDLFP